MKLFARNRAVAAYYPVGMGPIPTLKIAMLMRRRDGRVSPIF